MTREQKLERWAEREIERNIDHIILEHQNGSILAFGRYDIRPSNTGVTVWLNDENLGSFSSRKIALSWCVAHRRNMINFYTHLEALDRRGSDLLADITFSKRSAAQARNSATRSIINDKIQTKLWQANMIRCELEKYVHKAKYIQLRGFEYETARTRSN